MQISDKRALRPHWTASTAYSIWTSWTRMRCSGYYCQVKASQNKNKKYQNILTQSMIQRSKIQTKLAEPAEMVRRWFAPKSKCCLRVPTLVLATEERHLQSRFFQLSPLLYLKICFKKLNQSNLVISPAIDTSNVEEYLRRYGLMLVHSNLKSQAFFFYIQGTLSIQNAFAKHKIS